MAIAQHIIDDIASRFQKISPFLNERLKRIWAGVEAAALGYGGVAAVARATSMSVNTIRDGRGELEIPEAISTSPDVTRIRKEGGGRHRVEEGQPGIIDALLALVEPATRGEPDSALRWTSKSTEKLAFELNEQGYQVCGVTVARLLKDQEYSLQATQKTHEGRQHTDRNAQFEHIHNTVKDFHKRNQPAVSVDAKKKELIGNFPNTGREWQPKGQPEKVNAYTFPSLAKGKAVPYGVYDILANEGWVSVGISSDTAEFAVSSLRSWWTKMGQARYPQATELLVTADCGGSNSSRARLWKWELQRFANETGLSVRVMHFPPGTSKWNKIEHRMFNHITTAWRGRPLTSFEVVVNCIAQTTTSMGLYINAQLDKNIYECGIKISDQDMVSINIKRDQFHGDWNYVIQPLTELHS